MKILYVTGDDYSAMSIEQTMGIEQAAQLAENNGGRYTVSDDEVYAELSIMTFGEVDPQFVDFVNDKIRDYDDSKHTNYYVIES